MVAILQAQIRGECFTALLQPPQNDTPEEPATII